MRSTGEGFKALIVFFLGCSIFQQRRRNNFHAKFAKFGRSGTFPKFEKQVAASMPKRHARKNCLGNFSAEDVPADLKNDSSSAGIGFSNLQCQSVLVGANSRFLRSSENIAACGEFLKIFKKSLFSRNFQK